MKNLSIIQVLAIWLSLVLVVERCVAQGVNWSSLTQSQLSQLDPDLFRTINSVELSQIPVGACSGFKSSQISSLNGSACVGWSAQQISSLNTNQVPNSFTVSCFVNIPPASLSQISYSFLKAIDLTVFNSMSTSQVQAIPGNAFTGIGQDMLSGITAQQVCSGFTSSQMSNLQNTYPTFACTGFTGACIAKMQPSAFTGFTTACVSKLVKDSLMAMNASQVSSLVATTFSGFSTDNLQYLTSKGCSGITSNQIANLDNAYPRYACAGITVDCISAIPASSFNGMTSACVKRLTVQSVGGLSKSQLNQFADVSFGGFTSDNLVGLTNACSGMRGEQIKNFDNSYPSYACKGITSDCAASIPAETLSSILDSCIKTIPAQSVGSFTSKQLNNISPKAYKGFTSENVIYLGSSCSGFTADQLRFLDTSYPSYACRGIVGDCLSNMQDDSYSGLSSTCIGQLDIGSVNSIKSTQLNNITPDGITGLTADQISNLKGETCAGFTPDQVQQLKTAYPNYACKGFQKSCLTNFNLQAIPEMTSTCFGQIPSNVVSGFSTSAIPRFSQKSLSGMTTDQLIEFYSVFGVTNFVNVLDQKQLELVNHQVILSLKLKFERNQFISTRNFGKDEASSLTWLQLCSSTSNSVIEQLTIDLIPSIQPKTIQGLLNISQSLPDDFYSTFSIDQLDTLLQDTISSITGNQIKTINPNAFSNQKSFNLKFIYINLEAVQEVTDDQFRQLLSNQKNMAYAMTCAQFKSLSSHQRSFLQSNFNSYNGMDVGCNSPNPKPVTSGNNPNKPIRSNSSSLVTVSSLLMVMISLAASVFLN